MGCISKFPKTPKIHLVIKEIKAVAVCVCTFFIAETIICVKALTVYGFNSQIEKEDFPANPLD